MPRRSVAVWLTAVALLVTAVPVAQGDELEHKRDETRRRQGEMRQKLDLAQATEADLTGRLTDIERDLARRRAEAGAAQADADQASAAVVRIGAEIEDLRRQLDHRRQIFNRRAVTAYMGGEGRPLDELNVAGELLTLPRDFTDAARRAELVNRVSQQDGDALGRLVRTQAELALREIDLKAKREQAKTRARDAVNAVEAVAMLQREQHETRAALRTHIAELNTEMEALAAEQARVERLIKERLEAAARAARARAARPGRARTPFVGQRTGTGVSAQGFIWPVQGRVTSGYGPRWGRMHTGIDIAAPAGTPIAAAKHGWVLYTGYFGGYGKLVALDHGDGVVTLYAHQSKIEVVENQEVTQGQTIGRVGSTGRSTGNHLHFEIRVDSRPRDPRPYLP